jgi:2-dehydro-3-deoxygalactonokinase
MIGVDWGITQLRAYQIGAEGKILASRSAPQGIMAVKDGAFAATLEAVIGDWLDGEPEPVLMSGMIGSRQGWVEAPYVSCPARPEQVARALAEVTWGSGRRALVCPGLTCRDPDGVPDVMRGEEVQIFGALQALADAAASRICHPGTHSKHVTLEAGAVTGFRTYMTGEVFAVLRSHSILGRTMVEGPPDWQAFDQGVARSSQSGGLLHHLFGARARVLMSELTGASEADYLSGMLIGHEIHAAGGSGPLLVMGTEALAERYRRAFGLCGREARLFEGETATVRGLRLIHDLARSRTS